MEAELRHWLIDAGFPPGIELTAMRADLGSTTMWSFVPGAGAKPLVVRVFAAGADTDAEREWLAMDAAASQGLPVPVIVTRGTVMRRPLLVTTFVHGLLASQVLATQPERAHALGTVMGEALGRLHRVAAPARLRELGRRWIDRGGPALSPVRQLLEAVPDQDRLLHLDYHPLNVFLSDDRVTGIIDWENAAAGPPHMDLARTRAILRAAVAGGAMPPPLHQAVAEFERGLVAGHARVIGDDPFPKLSMAWGMAMTVDDLSQQADKPGSPISRTLVDRLAAERDALIRTLLTEDTPDWTLRG